MITITRRAPREIKQLLHDVAAPTRGFITVWQLNELGISASTVASLVQGNTLHRILRGEYHLMFDRARLSPEDWMLARVLAAGLDARLGGGAGIAAYDFTRFPAPTCIEIVTPRRCRVAIPESHMRIVTELHDQPRLFQKGMPVPDLDWLIADSGRYFTRFQIANVIHRAEYHRKRLHFDIDRFLAHVERSRGSGIVEVRRALDMHFATSAGTRSFSEDAFVGIVQDVTGRDPLVNCVLGLDGTTYEIDIGIMPERVHIHVDGGQHGRIHDAAVDPVRTAVAERNGFIEIREHFSVVQRDPRGCARRLVQALERARARRW